MEINRLPKVLLIFLTLFLIQEVLINQINFLVAGFSLSRLLYGLGNSRSEK